MTIDPEEPLARAHRLVAWLRTKEARPAAELAAAYGRRPQFRGISVDDMNAHQAATKHPRRGSGPA